MNASIAPLLFCLASSVAVLGSAGDARADGSGAPEQRAGLVDAGPNRLLLATGAATFAFAYGGSLWVGATSTRSSDRPLLVPFAGPWLSLLSHPACGSGGAPCGQETTYAALFIADGLVQAASAMQIALAFLHRDLRETHEPLVRAARVTLAPSRSAGGGLGLAAIGEF
jgi:hypothetical protein